VQGIKLPASLIARRAGAPAVPVAALRVARAGEGARAPRKVRPRLVSLEEDALAWGAPSACSFLMGFLLRELI
jgi:hypothetical protein